jgi:hypothetical protein
LLTIGAVAVAALLIQLTLVVMVVKAAEVVALLVLPTVVLEFLQVLQGVEEVQELGHKLLAEMVDLVLVAAVVEDPTTTDLIKVVMVDLALLLLDIKSK